MTETGTINFTYAKGIGFIGEITERSFGFDEGEEIEFPKSFKPRGLALRTLKIEKNWDGLFGWIRRRQKIYFITVATDLSGNPPTVMPPKELPVDPIHKVKFGEEISFTLGEGAPIFYPRSIVGGLAVFIMVCEADRGLKHVGETLKKIHEDLTAKQGAILNKLMALVTNPSATIADEVLAAASAILAPIATVLAASKDDTVGIAQGVFKANTDWANQLSQSFPGGSGSLALKEL
jgi:hypothetical protein